MDIREQKYFVAIAEECNLSKAARKLFVTQPSLSQFLSKLETSMDAQLFYRKSNNTLLLTEVGELYYENAQQILRMHSEFIKKIEDIKRTQSNKMTYGLSSDRGLGANFLSKVLYRLGEKYPGLCIETKQNSAKKLAELVINCELDFAFSAFEKKNPRLEYIELPPFEIAVVMSKEHPLAYLGITKADKNLPYLSLKKFKNEKFIMLKQTTILGNIQASYCASIGFIPDIKVETQHVATAFNMIANSSYIALCPYNFTPNLGNKFSYVGLDPPLYYFVGIYYNKNTYQTLVMKDFLKIAKELSITFK